MAQDFSGNWSDKAKNANGATVKREEPKSKGNLIMEIAEKIRPYLMNIFQGVRDENGQLYQPAHVRGIALNMAQALLKRHEANSQNS